MARTPNTSKAAPARTGARILSVKVTLRDVRPPIWRRLLVPAAMTLGDLHEAIQAAMGWRGGHLHLFDVDGVQYGDRGIVDDVADQERTTLAHVTRAGVSRFRYVYDFGDGWEHSLLVEAKPPPSGLTRYPACIAGRRSCPPEDCGGPWGYAELLEILADPEHPEHAERLEWLGGEFDPGDFDVGFADAAVAARFTRR